MLNFQDLRSANLARCPIAFFPLTSWSLPDWACALAGEVGEACNVVKKIHRLDTKQATHHERMQKTELLYNNLADELADVVIYADLLAARADINLAEAVRHKFNEVSEKRDCDIRL